MSDHTIDRDTPMARLRELAMDQRREVAPLPARLAEAQRRHARAQQSGWDVSDVVVTKDGRIALLQEDHTQVVSRVTTQIFAATMERQEAERVHRHLPANTRRFGDGWAYTVTNEFGDVFDLYLYWDRYTHSHRVRLLAPAIEELGDGHRHHIYGDGHICLSDHPGGGQKYINNAYAESVQWCNGVGAVLPCV